MPKTKYPSSFLRDRRTQLGLRQFEVAGKIGASYETYRQWESRGELPEACFQKISVALNVPEEELQMEKVAAIMKVKFKIPISNTRKFIARCLSKQSV